MSDACAPRYLAEPAALVGHPLPLAPAGLVLGRDGDGGPALVKLFAPRATSAGLVGGAALGRLLAFRAVALGARVVLRTTTPAQWHGFGEWATGRPDRVLVVDGRTPAPVPPADATQPVLHLVDLGDDGFAVPTPQLPWHTRLVLLRDLTPAGAQALADADVRLFRRLSPAEVSAAAAGLRLPPRIAQLLGALNPDMLGIMDGAEPRYVWLTPTSTERGHLGLDLP